MAKGNAPTQRLFAASKEKGKGGKRKYVDIGAVFENEKGTSVKLRGGTVIKVTSAWDPEEQEEVTLKEPVYLTADDWFFNLGSTDKDEREKRGAGKSGKNAPSDDDVPF